MVHLETYLPRIEGRVSRICFIDCYWGLWAYGFRLGTVGEGWLRRKYSACGGQT